MLRNTGVRESNSQFRMDLDWLELSSRGTIVESINDCDRLRFKMEKLN